MHAKTEYLDYYHGAKRSHYLSLDYINRTTDMVRIVDCNYEDRFFGVHWVSLDEAHKCITEESGRYLIY